MSSEQLNNESIQSDKNLKILLKEIDELNDEDNSNNKIEGGIIVKNRLNDGLKAYLSNNKIEALSIINKINNISTNNLSEESKQSLENLIKLISEVVDGSTESNETENRDLPIHNLTDNANQSFYALEKIIEEKGSLSLLNKDIQNIINYIDDDENNVKTLGIYIKILSLPVGKNKADIEVYNLITNTIRSHFNINKGLDIEEAKKLQINEIFKNANSKYELAKLYKIYIGGTWNGNILPKEGKIRTGNYSISYTDFINKFNEKLNEDGIKGSKTLGKEIGTKENLGIYNLLNLQNFDKEELTIIKTNSEDYYKGYNYTKEEIESHHRYKRGRIIENVQKYVQNTIKNNRDIANKEIVEKVRPDLVTLPKKEKIEIIKGIHKVVEKFNTIRKYINFKNGPYRNKYPNAKALLCGIRGITDEKIISNISNKITVKQQGVGLVFFVDDNESYYKIYGCGRTDGIGSGGFNCQSSHISDLKGTLSVVRGKDPGNKINDLKYGTILHEGQHNWNTYFMPEKDESYGPNKRETAIRRAKDEITAYIRDGRRNRTEIEKCLTKDKKDGGLYQYGLEGNDREAHKNMVKKLLGHAFTIINLTKKKIGLTKDKIISMLTDTPRKSRGTLTNKILKAVKNGDNLKDFWRTGIEKKETALNEIKYAKSLEEIKYILRNPKYSHIPRNPYNRGGIEIATLIDSITTNRDYITFIPPEIRDIVAKFIKK